MQVLCTVARGNDRETKSQMYSSLSGIHLVYFGTRLPSTPGDKHFTRVVLIIPS